MALRITRTRRAAPVRIEVSVSATVVGGIVSEEDLAVWVSVAVAEYHRFRGGYVGFGARAGITLPEVHRVGEAKNC